jgi:Flp pilus assembly protein TadD
MLVGLALLLSGACSSSQQAVSRAERAEAAGNDEEAIEIIEVALRSEPNDWRLQQDAGELYYRMAREALDEDRQEEYTRMLAQAQDHFLKALELAPESGEPHFWMGIVAVYQSELDRALLDFQNARRLQPRNPLAYSNVAETYIYLGELSKARRYLDRARKLGAPAPILEMNEVLAAWRGGDYTAARDTFATTYALNPNFVKTWNEAPVNQPIESFEDFTAFCCGHLACGPFMEQECQEMQLDAVTRSVSDETILQEIKLEMERRRRLQDIYEKRNDLKIEVEDPDAVER